MSLELIALYLLYPLFGLCTICTLVRYRMRVATAVYTVAFFVLFLYLPIYAGNDLLRILFSGESIDWSFAFYRDTTWNAFQNVTSYLTLPFFVAIIVSVFLCLSAVSVAITAIHVVRELRRRREPYRIISRRTERKIGTLRRIPKTYRFCQTFCRYNC